jgi:hypothetical protein
MRVVIRYAQEKENGDAEARQVRLYRSPSELKLLVPFRDGVVCRVLIGRINPWAWRHYAAVQLHADLVGCGHDGSEQLEKD